MAKGLFTQCLCLLTDGETTIADIKAALEEKDFEVIKQAQPQKDWRFGGPTLVVEYDAEDYGYIAIDLVNHPWPDSMGDPKTDSMTFGAWSMGHFGPLAFPGGLTRAGQHSYIWEDGKAVAKEHRGFIRIRLSYSFGAKDSDKVMPEDYDPLAELLVLSRIVLPLLKVPGVLCYFNPNGEVLRDRATFREHWNGCKKAEKIPLALWANIRLIRVNERFWLMDTVGNGQLDLKDVEAIFPKSKYEASDIDYYLRNVTLYLMGLDRSLKTGEEIDGPGESNLSWTIEVLKEPAVEPPRRVVRLYPKANRHAIQQALTEAKGSSG
jgi:Domain of unknown function (DUF4261)